MNEKRNKCCYLSIQLPGWILFVYLVMAQGVAALNYDWGVAMGTQEPAAKITEVGAAFWYGFAFGDLIIYIPLLAAGLIGELRGKRWSPAVLGAALGITAYWPAVCLAALVDARDAAGWSVVEAPYWIVCLLIAAWGLWGLWLLVNRTLDPNKPKS